jgi:hypothetical protein
MRRYRTKVEDPGLRPRGLILFIVHALSFIEHSELTRRDFIAFKLNQTTA